MTTTTFHQLSLVQSREMFRDVKTLFLSVLYPFVLMALFFGIGSLTPDSGGAGPGVQQMSIALGLFMAMGSVAFFGTAAPLVGMRERGTLRLLSTTPVRPAMILAAQLPGRLLVAAGQLFVIIAFGLGIGYLDAGDIPMLLVSCLMGLAVFGSLGYLIGGRMPSLEATNQVTSFGLVLFMFTSGLIMPLASLPEMLRNVFQVLPTTYFADLLMHFSVGSAATHPPGLSLGVLAAYIAVFTVAALFTFRWDTGEKA